MSRDGGFDRMDVSTSIADDSKFRALARRHADQIETALAVYVTGLLATSWREGERLTIEEAWPSIVPWDDATVDAMVEVGLLDASRRIPAEAWASWYGAAFDRRQLGRERQHRADVKRGRVATPDSPPDPLSPSGPAGPTGPSVSRTDSPSGRQAGPASDHTLDQRGTNVGPDREDAPTGNPKPDASRGSVNGSTTTTTTKAVPTEGYCRECGAWMTDRDLCRVGPGWIEHAEHPPELGNSP